MLTEERARRISELATALAEEVRAAGGVYLGLHVLPNRHMVMVQYDAQQIVRNVPGIAPTKPWLDKEGKAKQVLEATVAGVYCYAVAAPWDVRAALQEQEVSTHG